MTICRLTGYPYHVPEERGLLVLIGPAWLCAKAFAAELEWNPIPMAIAIASQTDSVATIVHTFDNKRFPFGGEVEI